MKNNKDLFFIKLFKNYYPLERFIFSDPENIVYQHDELLLMEIFIPQESDDDSSICVKVKAPCGEFWISYFDFSDNVRDEILTIFIGELFDGWDEAQDFINNDSSDIRDHITEVIREQKSLIEKRYTLCNIKDIQIKNLI